ncbi:Abi family protein [Mucilaginibacter sp.]
MHIGILNNTFVLTSSPRFPLDQRAQGEHFLFIAMPKSPYTKPALSYNDQLQQLKFRNLVIDDDAKALFLLENISYYRLSGYWYPLLEQPKSAHQFKQGATFNQGFNLYCFDRKLRKLVNAELEKIEVAIRAKMIYILSFSHDAFWYTNANLFSNTVKHANTLKKLQEEYSRSREDFILAYKAKYTNALPPSWMIFEVASFGVLSGLYQNLKPGRDKRAVSRYFGLDSSTFESWIHGIVYIRNLCAHHSRLWNKMLSISPVLPNKTDKVWLSTTDIVNTVTGAKTSVNNKTYYVLSMIVYLLQTVNPNNTFKDKIISLLTKYPNVDVSAMGFTSGWPAEPLWQ